MEQTMERKKGLTFFNFPFLPNFLLMLHEVGVSLPMLPPGPGEGASCLKLCSIACSPIWNIEVDLQGWYAVAAATPRNDLLIATFGYFYSMLCHYIVMFFDLKLFQTNIDKCDCLRLYQYIHTVYT